MKYCSMSSLYKSMDNTITFVVEGTAFFVACLAFFASLAAL